MGVLILTGCAAQPAQVSLAEAVTQLQTGQAALQCRAADCLTAWQRAAPLAAQFDASAHWADLAALVETTGYQDDLSLFYLGRAAEGLGYPGAAAKYYRQSVDVSNTAMSCRAASGQCGGMALPQAALTRLAAIDRALIPPSRVGRPVSPTPRAAAGPIAPQPEAPPAGSPAPLTPPTSTATPPPAAATAAVPPPLAAPASPPPPPPVPVPMSVPPPPSMPAGPPAVDYIEPPPEPR